MNLNDFRLHSQEFKLLSVTFNLHPTTLTGVLNYFQLLSQEFKTTFNSIHRKNMNFPTKLNMQPNRNIQPSVMWDQKLQFLESDVKLQLVTSVSVDHWKTSV